MENTIGERLKILIEKNEKTNAKAAQALGVSASLISDIINDKKKQGIGADIVKKICEHYKVSSDWLLGIRRIKPKRERFETITRATGLSSSVIEKLIKFNSASDYETELEGLEYRLAIELLIQNPHLLKLLHDYFSDMTFWNIEKDQAYITIDRADGSQGVFQAKTPEQRSLVRAINMNKLLECLINVYNTNSNAYKKQYFILSDCLDNQYCSVSTHNAESLKEDTDAPH